MAKHGYRFSESHRANISAAKRRRFAGRTHKRCSMCHVELPMDMFRTDGRRGRRSCCRACDRARRQELRRNEPPHVVAKRLAESRARYRAMTPEQKAKNLAAARAKQLARLGITEGDYARMLVEQCGVCAICGGDPGGGRKNFCVDHDHQTGAVRGLLCNACNRAIGLLKDNCVAMACAIDYLKKHKNDIDKTKNVC